MLHEFVSVNREEIIRRCRVKVSTRLAPPPTKSEIDYGVPMFLDQLVDELRLGVSRHPEINKTATRPELATRRNADSQVWTHAARRSNERSTSASVSASLRR